MIKSPADEGMTMMIATHEMEIFEEIADQIVFMDAGNVVLKQLFRMSFSEILKQFEPDSF